MKQKNKEKKPQCKLHSSESEKRGHTTDKDGRARCCVLPTSMAPKCLLQPSTLKWRAERGDLKFLSNWKLVCIRCFVLNKRIFLSLKKNLLGASGLLLSGLGTLEKLIWQNFLRKPLELLHIIPQRDSINFPFRPQTIFFLSSLSVCTLTSKQYSVAMEK